MKNNPPEIHSELLYIVLKASGSSVILSGLLRRYSHNILNDKWIVFDITQEKISSKASENPKTTEKFKDKKV